MLGTQYANLVLWTDIEPFEVIRDISPITKEIRRMNTKLLNPEELNFSVGGFAAHCSNLHDAKYEYMSSDEPTIRIRKRKNGSWHSSLGRHILNNIPIKHYDYNF